MPNTKISFIGFARYLKISKQIRPLSCFISFSLLQVSMYSFAQTEIVYNRFEENFSQNSNEILTVVATGTPRDTFNLPMQVALIENSGVKKHAQTATDLLKQQAGIQITGTARTNGQNMTMRGYDKRGILILVDGIKQGTDTGHIDGTFIDSSLIKRVEVVKGSNALLYGSGALGGVIAYQTVEANDLLLPGKDYGMTQFIQAGSGDNSIGSGVTAYGRTDNFDAIISGVFREKGDLKQPSFNSPNDEQIGNVMAKSNWFINNEHKLSTQFRFYQNDSKQPKNPQQNVTDNSPPLTISELNDSLVNRQSKQKDFNLGYFWKPINQDIIDLALNGYHQKVTIEQSELDSSQFESREQLKKGIKLENKSIWRSEFLASHLFTYGSEIFREEQTPNYEVKNVFPEAKIDFISLWIQDEITLKDLPASLIFGTRFDDYHAKNPVYEDVKADNWSSRAGLSFTPVDWFMIYASYAQAFRAPGLSELYNDSRHFSIGPFYTNNWIPNPDLKPERNDTQEYGFGLQFEELIQADDVFRVKVAYFDTKAKDYITTVVNMNFTNPPPALSALLPFGEGTTQSDNISRASIHGYEAEFAYKNPYVNVALSYSRVRGTNDYTGEWIESLSPDSISILTDIPLADTGLTFSWLSRFVDKSTRVNAATKIQPGYGVNDFYISYENTNILPNAFISFGLENAFNKDHYSPQGIPQASQNAILRASYRF